MPIQRLLIRADGDRQIGVGHVMRMLALAEAAVARGVRCAFASASLAPALEQRLRAAGVAIHNLDVAIGTTEDAHQTARLADAERAHAIVLDGYRFTADYQASLKSTGLTIVLVDDLADAPSYAVDIILNQNLYATTAMYAGRAPSASLLLGDRFVLIRDEFLKWKNWERETPQTAAYLLITLGGADSSRATEEILAAVSRLPLPGLQTTVVVGDANPRFDSLRDLASADPLINVMGGGTGLPELMAHADIAISAAGTTTWELAFMGLPNLLLAVADNQKLNAETAAAMGIARSLGLRADFDHQRLDDAIQALANDQQARAEMSRRGRALIDGLGSQRVLSAVDDAIRES